MTAAAAATATDTNRSTSTWVSSPGPLSRSDLVAATTIAVAMAAVFWFGSHGSSLRVTFVPGVLTAYVIAVWIGRTGRDLPPAASGLPLMLLALAWQFVHFAEENATDFARRFPAKYGGQPYGAEAFVTFNMVSYAVFTIAALGLWRLGIKKLLVPVLFFCVYGTYGNAVAHLWWTVQEGAYFPGFVTALLYWVLGPVLLNQFLGRWAITATVAAIYLALEVTLLSVFSA